MVALQFGFRWFVYWWFTGCLIFVVLFDLSCLLKVSYGLFVLFTVMFVG